MSYILDALVKAERERHLGQAPRLDDAPPRATVEPAESPGWWQAASTIIAAALVVATLLFVFLREPAAPPATSAAARAAVPAPAATDPAPKAAAPGPSSAAPVAATERSPQMRPKIDAIDQSAPIASLDDLVDQPEPAPPAPPPREALASGDTPGEPIATLDDGGNTQTTTLAPAPRARTQVGKLTLDPAPAGGAIALADMPAGYRDSFPALAMDVHVWNADPAKRFVLVNGRRYHEGDQLSDGPQIVEITGQGMVLQYNGQRVLYGL